MWKDKCVTSCATMYHNPQPPAVRPGFFSARRHREGLLLPPPIGAGIPAPPPVDAGIQLHQNKRVLAAGIDDFNA